MQLVRRYCHLCIAQKYTSVLFGVCAMKYLDITKRDCGGTKFAREADMNLPVGYINSSVFLKVQEKSRNKFTLVQDNFLRSVDKEPSYN